MGRPHLCALGLTNGHRHADQREPGVAQERRTIKECDKRIANFETALSLITNPDTLAGFARQIDRARAERKGAEIRLRRLTTGQLKVLYDHTGHRAQLSATPRVNDGVGGGT